MFFYILSLKNKSILFSTNIFDIPFYKNTILNRINLKEEKKLNTEINYPVGIYKKSDLIFSLIPSLEENPYLINIEEVSLNKLTEKLSRIIDENEEFIESNNIGINKSLIYNKLLSDFFPYTHEIRLIGDSESGVLTIFYLLFGLTISTRVINGEICHIPYNLKFKEKSIMLKKFDKAKMFQIGRELFQMDKYFFYIIDSTKNNDILRKKLSLKSLELNSDQKMIIIANQQDLAGAIKPEAIEKTTGFPTVGFSAIAPDAPERLEQIITEFLKD